MRKCIYSWAWSLLLLSAGPINAKTSNLDSTDPYEVLGFNRANGLPSFKEIETAWAYAVVANPYLALQSRNFLQNERVRNINRARDYLEWEVARFRRAQISIPGFDAFDHSWYSTFFQTRLDTFKRGVEVPVDAIAKAADLDVAVVGFGEPRVSPVWEAVEITRTESRYAKLRLAVPAFFIPYRLKYETSLYDLVSDVRSIGFSQQALGLYQSPMVYAVLLDIWERYSQAQIDIDVFNPFGERETVTGKLIQLGDSGDYLEPYFTLEIGSGAGAWTRNIATRSIDFNTLLMRTGILRRIYGDFGRGKFPLSDNCEWKTQ